MDEAGLHSDAGATLVRDNSDDFAFCTQELVIWQNSSGTPRAESFTTLSRDFMRRTWYYDQIEPLCLLSPVATERLL